jgi:hypothetical protein
VCMQDWTGGNQAFARGRALLSSHRFSSVLEGGHDGDGSGQDVFRGS